MQSVKIETARPRVFCGLFPLFFIQIIFQVYYQSIKNVLVLNYLRSLAYTFHIQNIRSTDVDRQNTMSLLHARATKAHVHANGFL